ncbi:MAG: hypothetical protein JNK02_10745 [Planctomycetes bacterium]|nr:hypothetical protein [Planctomycetota bacterium]
MRILITLTSAIALGASGSAQSPRPAPSARDAGVLHLDTGTWTRRAAAQATLGADVLYDNTCPTGYYMGLSVDTFVDEGRLPSPGAPAPTGCATNYRIDGFRFSYCTDQTAATIGTYTHRFYPNHPACATILGVTPAATIDLASLPASPALGLVTCWTVTIDLGVSGSFVLPADGDGVYQGGSSADRFAWAMSSSSPASSLTGPVIAGNPAVCAPGAGTTFSGLPGPGTGLGNNDSFRLEPPPPTWGGCYWLGGDPFGGFELVLFGEACPASGVTALVVCAGDGSGTACPCGNTSPAGAGDGCLNSLGRGGRLRAFGIASLSNDQLTLLGSQMPDAPGLYFQGTSAQSAGQGSTFGDGLRCASGTLVRLGVQTNAAGASQHPGPHEPRIATQGGVTVPGTRVYQVWYRNVAPFCAPEGFNLTNGLLVDWAP